MYRIDTTPEFDRDIKALDPPVFTRLIRKIEWLAEHPELLKSPLKGMPDDLKGLQKYRFGDYRILLWTDHHAKAITLYGIEHRSRVYKKFR